MCTMLSWITLSVEGATGSSPVQIMLFHYGEYIGTATESGEQYGTGTEETAHRATYCSPLDPCWQGRLLGACGSEGPLWLRGGGTGLPFPRRQGGAAGETAGASAEAPWEESFCGLSVGDGKRGRGVDSSPVSRGRM